MAFRFKVGKFKLRGFSFPRFGVRGSLFAAFAVIAGMAIVISAGAGLELGRLGVTMVDLSGRDIPRLAASLQLSAQSASLASQGPALLAARSEEALNERSKKMKETQTLALQKLGEIIELGADKNVVAALQETVKNIDDMIKSLGSAARERLDVAALHDKQYAALRKAQADFVAASAPAMMDAQAQINAILGAANLSTDDASEAARNVELLGNVIASTNLMASDMTAALSANNSDTLEAIEKEFKETQARVKSNLETLPKNASTKALSEAALKLLSLGEGKTRVFKIRQQELDSTDYGETILEETRKLNVGLGISVQQLVDGVRKETDSSTWQARQEISLATMVMLGAGALTLIGSILFVWLYVGRSILRRIRSLQRSMQLLSSGDLESEIYQSHQTDEIAAMADSLLVFRDSMIQSRALSADQDKDRIAKSERATRMEAQIDSLRSHRSHGARQPAIGGGLDADHRAEHVDDRGSIQRAGQRGGLGRRGNLGQRADRVVGHRAIVVVDRRDQPPGRHLGGNRPQGGRGSRRHRRHHAGAGRQRRTHRRGGRPDPEHRLADQPAGAERHHRSRPRR